MKKQIFHAVILASLLASCSHSKKDANGQVVATVDGRQITEAQIKLEMNGASDTPEGRQAALQTIISRTIVARAAEDRGLAKSPGAVTVIQRAKDNALVEILQSSIAAGVPKDSDAEVADFIQSHPTAFSQRRLWTLDQLSVPTITQDLVKKMQPLKTMAEIVNLLDTNHVDYVPAAAVLDTVNMPPEAVNQIIKLGEDEVFITPNSGGGAIVSHIANVRTVPLTGKVATTVGRAMMSQQRKQQQVREAIEKIVKGGQSLVDMTPAYKRKATKS